MRRVAQFLAAISLAAILTACIPPGPTDAEIEQAVREASAASQSGSDFRSDDDSWSDNRARSGSALDKYERDAERRRREEATTEDMRPSLASDPEPTTDLSRYDRR